MMEQLKQMLEAYRNGDRPMPTYAELAAIAERELELESALKDMRMSISYRAACVIEGNAEKIAYANDRVWKAHEKAGEILFKGAAQ
jgi:hypothetical protein